jgi:subtilisin family serine protease
MKKMFFLLFLFCVCAAQSQDTYMYRLILKDKGNPSFSLSNPEAFLSRKSIDRRHRQGLLIDSIDMPIDPIYFNAIKNTGANIRTYSKWVKTVVVHLSDLQIIPALENLPFVDSLYCVWKGVLPEAMGKSAEKSAPADSLQSLVNKLTTGNRNQTAKVQSDKQSDYGDGFGQIRINNGHLLHDAGFYGQGMSIAVVDGGFLDADKIDYFDWSKVIEVKNFNHEIDDPLNGGAANHGTKVLSCMLSDKRGKLIGTAPRANYYLFRTEVSIGEFPVEEDYWVAALEYADSLGVDVLTTSLGYSTFDGTAVTNHTRAQLDGKTVPISKAASLAASRGMLLFLSAGNEGNKSWTNITFPADAENVITVGSVMRDSTLSGFSSRGPTADKRVKPDLVAMGSGVRVVVNSGNSVTSDGTSFSTPIMAGLGACLWGAFPDLKASELIRFLRESGNRYQNPNEFYGYGIADVYKAYNNIKSNVHAAIGKPVNEDRQRLLSIRENRLFLMENPAQYEKCVLNVYSGMGIHLLSVSDFSGSIDISFLPKGIYIAHLQIGDKRYAQKLAKL